MNKKLQRGVQIVTEKWLQVTAGESLLIVTSEDHIHEMTLIAEHARQMNVQVEVMTFTKQKGQVGHYFDEQEKAFDSYDVILGATTHSLVTTKAVKRAITRGSRFLSLPLATNNGQSLLEYDFLLMDPNESTVMAEELLVKLKSAKELRVTTHVGTDMTFSMEGREAQLFTGATKEGSGYASSSFEIFIPVVEDKTNGMGIVDASLGYLGVPEIPVKIYLKDGKVCEIEQNATGEKLSEYMKSFEDDGMYVAGEFGIGLNRFSRCQGNSYIEDESAYGTFHIGFGRNIAFGGANEAKAHFDLVFDKPNIYADGILIMREGKIIWTNQDSIAI